MGTLLDRSVARDPFLKTTVRVYDKRSHVSLLSEGRRQCRFPRVINPDDIAKEMNPGIRMPPHWQRVARHSRNVRALCRGREFAIETTFSGNSERRLLATAKAAGYTITMTYIALNDVDRTVWRVDRRAETEIRPVSAEDILRRYGRSLKNVAAIADQIDALRVFDNSGKTFEHVLTMRRGQIVILADLIPPWVERTFGIPPSK